MEPRSHWAALFMNQKANVSTFSIGASLRWEIGKQAREAQEPYRIILSLRDIRAERERPVLDCA